MVQRILTCSFMSINLTFMPQEFIHSFVEMSTYYFRCIHIMGFSLDEGTDYQIYFIFLEFRRVEQLKCSWFILKDKRINHVH